MRMDNGVLHLDTAIKHYAHTDRLISGAISDPLVKLDCVKVEPIHRAFAPMARKQAYDVSEMAIVTYLQAKAYNKPLIMLPTVVAARLQQGCIVYNAKRGHMDISDLAGARVGVRAYTQTTGMWVRAILAQTYGMLSENINWITFEGSHLAEYEDPAFVTHAPEGKNMLDMLLAGELDAAIFGNDLPGNEGIVPLIPNPVEADRIWYEQHRFVPINHVIVMHREVAEKTPHSVKSVYRMFKQGKADAKPTPGIPNKLPDGISGIRQPLEMILDFCNTQQLLPRKLGLDEIFADSIAFLGEDAQ
ncbi:hypothetical protein ACO0LO_08210 [Undibacterium sp. TJN25]|uniref:hypothetical protein n=1 Tax=Undibacterium sp. TJN25 TaxID=3413056 RepID=UPI003BF084F8